VKFDIYGRFQLDVIREGDAWIVFRLAAGKRIRSNDLTIPADLRPSEIATYLDDLFHEVAMPGKDVRLVAD
jgi:hypothetical protein